MNIITSYLYVEKLLAEFLESVPYEQSTPTPQMPPESVWSPRLAMILQETCSQIDSYFRHELTRTGTALRAGRKDFDIVDYATHFGSWLSERKLLFWEDDYGNAVSISPFKGMTPTTPSPDWWASYNKVKHDRIEHKRKATLKHCVNALGGLFLAIVRLAGINTDTRFVLTASGLWDVTNGKAVDLNESDPNQCWRNLQCYNVIETSMFTYVPGWWHTPTVEAWVKQPVNTKPEMRIWGAFDDINHPERVAGSGRWKMFFQGWAAKLPPNVGNITTIPPLFDF